MSPAATAAGPSSARTSISGVRVAYVPLYAFGVRQICSLVWLISTAGLVIIAIRILTPALA